MGMLSRSHVSYTVDNASCASDTDEDLNYHTDATTPASSDSCQDEIESCEDEVEDFRDREYPQLRGKVYLDHGGSTLYAKSLIDDFSADLISNLYGNPHSASSPSAVSGHRVDAIREKALLFFNANPDEWDLVFVANATAAIKLVMECFRDHAAATNTPVWYGYHRDSHTSVVGVRELTRTHRCFASDEEVDIWINSGGIGGPRARQLGLFAYPGQSNMTGRRLPLSWPGRIRKSITRAATYTLLDAAALASTAPLDLSDIATAPDFVALSFYKIFGFPNVGALLVRKESQHVLENRRYFGGGTVDMIIAVSDTWHAKKEASLHERLEDGTLPFHSIFALDHAIDVHKRLYGPKPMSYISHHTAQLGKLLYESLSRMRHSNGRPVAIMYNDQNATFGDPTVQGATLALNIQRADGTLVGYQDVEEAADARNIFVRSGSLCNPGGVATYLKWSPAEMRAAFAAGHRCSHPTQVMLGKPTGVVRISLGAMSTVADVLAFVHFLDEVYVESESEVQTAKAVQTLPSLTYTDNQADRLTSISPIATTSVSQHLPTLRIPHAPFEVPAGVQSKVHIPQSATHSPTSHGAPSPHDSVWDNSTTAADTSGGTISTVSKSTSTTHIIAEVTSTSTSNRTPPAAAPSQSISQPSLQCHLIQGPTVGKPIQQLGNELKDSGSTPAVIPAARAGQARRSPSVIKSRGRIFGRSVVNLLHRKSHAHLQPESAHPDLPLPAR